VMPSVPDGLPPQGEVDGTLNETAPPVLTLSCITAGYGDFTALWDVTIEVPQGSVVALVGPNGAGKTTLLKVASGLLRPKVGTVLLDGVNVTKQSATQRSRAGICLIPEGRGIYQSLTVKENLQLDIPIGASLRAIERAFDTFPILGSRMNQRAGSLSGGEQQMLALSRAYLSEPRVVLLDELSMGLAPLVVDAILSSLQPLIASGVAILIVEQFVRRALAMADSVTVLARGRSLFQGQPESLTERELSGAYLGGEV
jgi:branched-chain amino acid transport system ATP-binding protein